MATSRSIDERRDLVLSAAAEMVWSSAASWATSITYGELEVASGVDRSQIARDFGSKDGLIKDLITRLLDPEDRDAVADHVDDVVDVPEPGSLTLGEQVELYAELSREFQKAVVDQYRAEMLLWAAGSEGSEEWKQLGNAHRREVEAPLAAMQRWQDQVVANGGHARTDISLEELCILLSFVVEGIMIRERTTPEMIDPSLLARATKLLTCGVLGPDPINPTETLDDLKT